MALGTNRMTWSVMLLLPLLLPLLLLTGTAVADGAADGNCDSCKFFPTVCDNIDYCVENCNIAPTMRSSCAEL